MAIKIETRHPIDSVVNMYISKYGEAETPIINYIDMPFLSLPSKYIMSYEDKFLPMDYSWTFSNAEIHVTNNGFLDNKEDCNVIYFDKKCIAMLDNKEKREDQMRKKLERMENDKKRKQNDEVKIQQEKERKRMIQNHEKSLTKVSQVAKDLHNLT